REYITIVKVVKQNEECPSTATYKPITKSNLVEVSARQNDQIILAPDIILVGVILLAFFSLIAFIIAAAHCFRTRGWNIGAAKKPNYRVQLALDKLGTKGKDQQRNILFDSKMDDEMDNFIVDLTEFNVKKFYEELKKYNDNMSDKLGYHQNKAMDLYKKIYDQTEIIKSLLGKHAGQNETLYEIKAYLDSVLNRPKSGSTDAETMIKEFNTKVDRLLQELKEKKAEVPNKDMDANTRSKYSALAKKENGIQDELIVLYKGMIKNLQTIKNEMKKLEEIDDPE